MGRVEGLGFLKLSGAKPNRRIEYVIEHVQGTLGSRGTFGALWVAWDTWVLRTLRSGFLGHLELLGHYLGHLIHWTHVG